MSQISTSPYINFAGKAREAMQFYQKVLGGDLQLMAFNPHGVPKEAGPEDAIMHSQLEIDGEILLMGTDGMAEYPAKVGDNWAVALSGTDDEKLTQAFEVLSEGGNVKQNLKTESWGDKFGWIEDKFKVNWMVNITKPKS
jgi:PhnB protein